MLSMIDELREYVERSKQGWNISILDEQTVGKDVINSHLDYYCHSLEYIIDKLIPGRIWVVWLAGGMVEVMIGEDTTKQDLEKYMPELKKCIDDSERYWSELREAQH